MKVQLIVVVCWVVLVVTMVRLVAMTAPSGVKMAGTVVKWKTGK